MTAWTSRLLDDSGNPQKLKKDSNLSNMIRTLLGREHGILSESLQHFEPDAPEAGFFAFAQNEFENENCVSSAWNDNISVSHCTYIYFGARYYNPLIGRWISKDNSPGEIDEPQSLNRFIYCQNNPLKFIDPDGKRIQFASNTTYEQLAAYSLAIV